MRASTSHRYFERIERVVDALLSAPADAHSVESLAAVANMPAFHFAASRGSHPRSIGAAIKSSVTHIHCRP